MDDGTFRTFFWMMEDAEGHSDDFLAMDALTTFLLSGQPEVNPRTLQGEEPLDTGGGRVFSLDATSGLLATAGAIGAGELLVLSAQPLWCELYDMKD